MTNLLYGIVVYASVIGADASRDHMLMNIVEEAFAQGEASLKSQRAVGRYRVYVPSINGTGELGLIQSAEAKVLFDRPRYYISLDFDQHEKGIDHRIIIYDGNAIAVSRFTPRINVTGGEADIYLAREMSDGSVIPEFSGFPWDPSHLDYDLASISALLKNIPEENIAATEETDGDIMLTYHIGKNTFQLMCHKDDGFHVSDMKGMNPRGDLMVHVSCKWIQVDDIWSLSYIRREVEYDSKSRRRTELEFTTIEPNVPIDPKYFMLDALGLPGGARIIDRRRPEARVEDLIHYVPVGDDQVDRSVGELVKEVERLPTLQDPGTREKRGGDGTFNKMHSVSVWVICVVNVIVILFILALVLWGKSRRMNSK